MATETACSRMYHDRLSPEPDCPRGQALSVAGLFAGIGGIERGLAQAGHACEFLCENLPQAQAVLRTHFPEVPLAADIRELPSLPDVDMVTAGFPCQDLSPVGRTAGIDGANSGLVKEVLRLVEVGPGDPRWLLLENVPFMLHLNGGQAMRYLTRSLSDLGYQWAYRVIDTRAFGLPHRRRRVWLLASRTDDPRAVLFGSDAALPSGSAGEGTARGFYWTEGSRGLGWAMDAVPTLKGGSGLGIPAPPAIWVPGERFVGIPDIRDAERLQGLPANWTEPAITRRCTRGGVRWRLVGNAVSVPVAEWIGTRLFAAASYDASGDFVMGPADPWPTAAWGRGKELYRVSASEWPVDRHYRPLLGFLRFPMEALSRRATAGFLSRIEASTLRTEPGFLVDVAAHLERMQNGEGARWFPPVGR